MSKPHNPAGVPADKIGYGWRLLDADEIRHRPPTNEIQMYYPNAGVWDTKTAWEGYNPVSTYRTKLNREQLAALNA